MASHYLTGGHANRVAKISVYIGNIIGITKSSCGLVKFEADDRASWIMFLNPKNPNHVVLGANPPACKSAWMDYK